MPSGELDLQQEGASLAPDDEERVRFALQCFQSTESFLEFREFKPIGHPDIANTVRETHEAFESYFNLADALRVQVDPEAFSHFPSTRPVWETARAMKAAEQFRDAGIDFVIFESGLAPGELHRFLDLLDRCDAFTDQGIDPAVDLDFTHIVLDWIDPSAARLSGVETTYPEPDSKEETLATQRLFEREFENRFEASKGRSSTLLEFFSQRSPALDHMARDGSDPKNRLAQLDAEDRKHIESLRETAETPGAIERRQVDMLASILARRPKSDVARAIVDRIRGTIRRLVDNDNFDAARICTKLVRSWTKKVDEELDPSPSEALQQVLDEARLQRLAELVSTADKETRKELLKFLHVIRSVEATKAMASLSEWDLPAAAHRDVFRYLENRTQEEFRHFTDVIGTLTTKRAQRLIDAAAEGLPTTKQFLQEVLRRDVVARIKSEALRQLAGLWDDPDEVSTYVTPLVGSTDVTLRGLAIETISQSAPDQIGDTLGPFVNETLGERSLEDLENIVSAYAEHGGSEALVKLEELVRVKGFVSDERRDLGTNVIRALVDVEASDVDLLLERVADEWLVPKAIRRAAKETLYSRRERGNRTKPEDVSD